MKLLAKSFPKLNAGVCDPKNFKALYMKLFVSFMHEVFDQGSRKASYMELLAKSFPRLHA